MPDLYELLKEKGISEHRREFIRLIREQDREIDDLMDKTSNQVVKLVNQSKNSDGSLNERKFDNYIKYIFAFWALNFTNILINANQKATEIVTSEGLTLTERYESGEIESYILKRGEKLLDGIEKWLLTRKIYSDDVTLQWRIKTIEKSYIKTVQDIVKAGAKQGLSTFQVAKEIDNIIKPKGYKKWISPFDWFRAVRGGDVTGRRGGSVSYNSYRIARTELNETYRRQTFRLHEGQPYIEGFMFNLSPAHPERDICDDYDGQIFQREIDMPETHPNCYCYMTPVLVKPDEL